MPYCEELDPAATPLPPAGCDVVQTDWRRQLPMLRGRKVTLRELEISDAASLCELLSTEEVARFISPPPTTVLGFQRFIAWTKQQRAARNYVCFAVIVEGCDAAIGIFQVRATVPPVRKLSWGTTCETALSFMTAEWGFAIGSPFWGTGVFQEGARLVLDFVFETLGTRRLEARASVKNGRGNGALFKMRAVKEGLLRRSFLRDGEYLDQNLWSIAVEDWWTAKKFDRTVQ